MPECVETPTTSTNPTAEEVDTAIWTSPDTFGPILWPFWFPENTQSIAQYIKIWRWNQANDEVTEYGTVLENGLYDFGGCQWKRIDYGISTWISQRLEINLMIHYAAAPFVYTPPVTQQYFPGILTNVAAIGILLIPPIAFGLMPITGSASNRKTRKLT